MRWANRRDGNHVEIVKDLAKLGFEVVDTSRVGDGFPDLIVGYKGKTGLVEIKIKGQGLGKEQAEFHSRWTGGIIILARCAEDVMEAMS